MRVSYNGVLFPEGLTQTTHFSCGSEKDQSGTDQLYTTIRLSVRSVLSNTSLPLPPGQFANQTPAEQATVLRHYLTAPRKPLRVHLADVPIIDLPLGFDDGNGPFPDEQALRVVHVAEATFVVEWTVVVKTVDCPGAYAKPWLSCRWDMTSEYDERMRATRRTAGTVVLSRLGPVDHEDVRASLPGRPLLRCQAGFKRVRSSYRVDKTGLVGTFDYTDVEQDNVPPFPASRLGGFQLETVPERSAVRRGNVHVRLEGPPRVNARTLLDLAISIAYGRMVRSSVFTKAGVPVMLGAAFKEDFETRAVEVTLNYMMKPTVARVNAGQHPQALPRFAPAGVVGQMGLNLVAPPAPVVPNNEGQNQAALPINADWVGSGIPGEDKSRPVNGAAEWKELAVNCGVFASLLGDLCGQEVMPGVWGTGNRDAPPVAGDWVGRNTAAAVSPDGTETINWTTAGGAQIEAGVLNVIPADDYNALYTTDQSPAGTDCWPYDRYLCSVTYHDDSGRRILPSTAESGTASVVRLHGGVMTMRVEWAAERPGEPPEIPPAESGDDNIVYLKGDRTDANLDTLPDGATPTYRVEGWTEYGVLDRSAVSPGPIVPPFLQASLARQLAEKMSRAAGAALKDVLPGGTGGNTFVSRNLDPDTGSGGTGLDVPRA